MSQNPNGPNYNPYGQNPSNPNYDPYGQNPSNPNYPNPPGTAYGNNQQIPPVPNSGTPYPPANPNTPNSGMPYPPANPNTPNSGYGQYDNFYAPPPPPTENNPYTNLATPPPVNSGPNPYDPYSQTVFSPHSNPGLPPQSYNAYQPIGTLPPPQPTTPQKRGRGATILIVIIALVIIIGGAIAGVVINTNNQNTLHATATAQAGATRTALIQNTAFVQSTQTAVASNYPFSNNLVLNDPLTDNSKGFNWDNDGKFCFFSGSAYHVFDDQANTYSVCMGSKTSYTNFTFESEMLIKQGADDTEGGLVFRADTTNNNNKLYRFVIDTQGNYSVLIAVDTTGNNTRTLKSGSVSAFTTGMNSTNTLGVVARGDQISLYVNQQLVTTLTDSTYSQGEIGFDVDNISAKSSEVVFSNAKVWQLTN